MGRTPADRGLLTAAEVPAVALRAFRDEDLADCQRIAGSAPDYAHSINVNADAIEVAVSEDRVVAFAFLQVWSWNRVAWLGDVVVERAFRGRGIGRLMVARMEQRARELGCRVLMDHPPATHRAVQFYLANGFRLCGYNDRFYPSGDRTALFLAKDLE